MLTFSRFFNKTRRRCKFPSILKKNAYITTVFREVSRNLKKAIVNVLQIISKIFEKIISKQVTNFIDPSLSKCQCWFLS